MAILTDVGRLDVRWILADCFDPVVATNAVARDIGVIEIGCRHPGSGDMAVIACIATRYVRGIFTDRGDAIVT